VPRPVPRLGIEEKAKMTPAHRTTGAQRRNVGDDGTSR
jgi:hypothetical protein